MNAQQRTLAALLTVAGLGAAGAAQARDVDIRWQVAIPGPVSVVVGNTAPRYLPPVVVVQPRVVAPVHGRGYGDADRDGVPNRYDRHYNPRWDRDGDGIPNRRDAVYNPPWDRDGDGIPNRHDRRDDRYDDRRGDHRHGRGHGR
jgi:hypothetical protein